METIAPVIVVAPTTDARALAGELDSLRVMLDHGELTVGQVLHVLEVAIAEEYWLLYGTLMPQGG